jgi:hypothetical protein
MCSRVNTVPAPVTAAAHNAPLTGAIEGLLDTPGELKPLELSATTELMVAATGFVGLPISHVETNPIVAAAAEYTGAQRKVETVQNEMHKLNARLVDVEAMLREATADRDTKKQILQALVAS